MSTAPDLFALLRNAAEEEGFPLAGAVDLGLARDALAENVSRYDQWLAAGRAGAMEYLVRGRDRRADPTLVFPRAKSVFCVGIPYDASPCGAADPLDGPRFARYIGDRDYHEELQERLTRALVRANERWIAAGHASLEWKVCVDTSAVLERAWAALAGFGWIGKNTLLIHPEHGSYLFIAEAFLSEETGRAPAPLRDLCGHCERCLRGCPTGALAAAEPRALDSRKCVSYWTLEKRGELGLREGDLRGLGPWVAGCDVCQEVCPFNQKRAKAVAERRMVQRWEELFAEDPVAYRARTAHSAMNRMKPAQFSRNLALAATHVLLTESDPERRARFVNFLTSRVPARLAGETDPAARTAWERLSQALS